MPQPTLAVGVTGHRSTHPSYPADPAALDAALGDLLAQLEQAAGTAKIHSPTPVPKPFCRVVTLLADGVDLLAARHALTRDWDVTAPLPFGLALNIAVNAGASSAEDAKAILRADSATDPDTQARAAAIRALANEAKLFELADEDDLIEPLLLKTLEKPDDQAAASTFLHEGSRRAAISGQILIEQSDILIAVWDGVHTANQGGTGHTAMQALEAGVPVIWIDPANPQSQRIVRTPEALASVLQSECVEAKGTIETLVADCIGLGSPKASGKFTGLAALTKDGWRPKSSFGSHAYRRIEAIFGSESLGEKFASVRQSYEAPSEIAAGSGAPLIEALRELDESQSGLASDIADNVLPRFALAEGIAARLSNLYRSGMVINFLLGAMAIIAGVLYLPLVETSQKWIFAAIELTLLLIIVANTLIGRQARFHGRWLETRRTAEYLRHLPLMLCMGVARPAGSWPSGLHAEWPEWYAKNVMRRSGLPPVKVDKAYLRRAARSIRENFITPQADYHRNKADRLHRAHHAIERFAERMFGLAVLVVATYLTAFAASKLGFFPSDLVDGVAKWFTVIALALPTVSGAFAAIGYFGDFDRFADISAMTAERLAKIEERMKTLEALPDERLTYAHLADLARMTDQTTFDEIQSWQAVFSGKRTTVPA